MKIGLVGEAPNDTAAIKNLMLKKYSDEHFTFVNILNNINGSQLDSQKTKRLLRKEFEFHKPNLVIFIRDLDGLASNKEQITKRKTFFNEFGSVVNKRGIPLLHIYEIECLIFYDIEKFNEVYGCQVPFSDNPMLIIEPKELLKKYSKQYSESYNSELFNLLDFEKLMICPYLKDFINKFESIVYR